MKEIKKHTINRRNFIRLSGMTGAILTVGFYFGCKNGKDEAVLQNLSDVDPHTAKELSPFIMIDTKGNVALIAHKPEMGQGTFQSMPLIVAEELGVTLDHVTIKPAIANKKYGDMSVGGSNSVRGSWMLLRKAGAAAREMLVTVAAKRWNVAADQCKVDKGFVIHTDGNKQFSFGEL